MKAHAYAPMFMGVPIKLHEANHLAHRIAKKRKKFTTQHVKGKTKDLDACAHRGAAHDQKQYLNDLKGLGRLTVDEYLKIHKSV
jgi:hypothetical protein